MATWNIKDLKRNIQDGGVTKAEWEVILEDSGHTSRAIGSTSFTPDPSADSFIAYTELTENKVIEWVKAQEDVDAIETYLTTDITEKKTPATAEGVPWG